MQYIGAKDAIDRALVKQYSKIQTTNFDEPRVNSEDMWKKLNMHAAFQRNQIEFTKYKKAS